ncbi:MAG TPA: hypothetical protein VFN25_13830 [Dokdonella sp.]|uniref:hypothetical protein n=1 Tax=Dokdonella sp. TaxID=2291710 RepID=UPI002D7F5C36|nr:hypothetical protein [Dokdonella sp.]HET9033970.1 hypothetical protein [Dokdonella sp.]
MVFGVIVAAICVLGWIAFERRGGSLEASSDRAPGAHAEDESSTPLHTATQHPKERPKPKLQPKAYYASDSKNAFINSTIDELPNFLAPPDQAIARLRVLADAGNDDAKLELTRRLSGCTPRALRATQESDERLRWSLEMDQAKRDAGEEVRAIPFANGQGRIDRHLAERAACEALPAEVLENWLDPIDQVARSGDTYAMRYYAELVVNEYDSRDAVVADVDRAILRRDKARAYLQRAVDLGDSEALSDLADAYFNKQTSAPQLYAVDSFRAYLYAYAASFGPRRQYQNLDWIMSESAKALDTQQISDARKQGKRLYDACCR